MKRSDQGRKQTNLAGTGDLSRHKEEQTYVQERKRKARCVQQQRIQAGSMIYKAI